MNPFLRKELLKRNVKIEEHVSMSWKLEWKRKLKYNLVLQFDICILKYLVGFVIAVALFQKLRKIII